MTTKNPALSQRSRQLINWIWPAAVILLFVIAAFNIVEYGDLRAQSYAAIREQEATDVIAEFYSHLGEQIPIIGVGGIMNADHAQAKLKAGAKLIQVYSGFIYHGPPLVKEIIKATAQ